MVRIFFHISYSRSDENGKLIAVYSYLFEFGREDRG
jgi:hypothetical protein